MVAQEEHRRDDADHGEREQTTLGNGGRERGHIDTVPRKV